MLERLASTTLEYLPTKVKLAVGLGILRATWFVLPIIGGKCQKCGHDRDIHGKRGRCELCSVIGEGRCE